MDKQGNRFSDEKQTMIFDLDEANIKEDQAEDIDTLYEENENIERGSSDEHTKIVSLPGSSDKNRNKRKEKKRSKKSRESRITENTLSDEATQLDEKHEDEEEKEKDLKRDQRLKDKNAKKLDKLMKKQKKREEKSDREVLSYEDMPLKERERSSAKKSGKSGKKKLIIVLLILLVVFGAVFIFANTNKLSWHNIRNYVKYGLLNQKSEEQFPVSIQGENVDIGNFTRMGQDVCYASDTKLQIINNYGRLEYTTQHGFLNPVMKASDQYAMIYSLGGTGYQINNYEKMLFSGTAEERIVTGAINDNGVYALVTTSKGYLSKLQVYDNENEKIFGYSFADYYVTSVSLAPNGKCAVVTGLSALNGAEISSLYVLDFTKDKPLYQEEVDDNIFYDVQYLNDSYACAVGNGAVSTINTKNGEVNTMKYDGKTLTCYCFNRDTDTASVSLSRSGDGRNCEIYSFKTDGTVSDSFETEYMVKCISTYKGRIALLTPDVIYLYSKDGQVVSQYETSTEPQAIVLYTTDDAYVLDTNGISVVKI